MATLRTWEQRYQAVLPATLPSGHRMYSPADVQRVLLLRRLTREGYAIGSIAALDVERLQDLADGRTAGRPGTAQKLAASGLRAVVIGQALAVRLQRPAVTRGLSRTLRAVAVFDTLEEAARARHTKPCDLLLWQVPPLQADPTPVLLAARRVWQPRLTAVVYRFADATVRRRLSDAGAAITREPPDDEAWSAWLASLESSTAGAHRPQPLPEPAPAPAASDAPARPRFDEATLTAIAGLPPRMACECPRHVAELLMQLTSFESYSAGCADRNAADAQLHTYLRQVAAAARTLFESALERVALHEGLSLTGG
ncbi:MAG: MerR family transcriptional regulator [Burkholderiales bacterium]|nr:MerR family transcriptional regulator [Burkholderiales bacterium]